jgi:hypothetical protein
MEVREQTTRVMICAHHWRIAPPSGTYSTGVCAKCGTERQFANSSETTGFGYGRTKPRPQS